MLWIHKIDQLCSGIMSMGPVLLLNLYSHLSDAKQRQRSRSKSICTEKGILRESSVNLRDQIIKHHVLTSEIEKSRAFWSRDRALCGKTFAGHPKPTLHRERSLFDARTGTTVEAWYHTHDLRTAIIQWNHKLVTSQCVMVTWPELHIRTFVTSWPKSVMSRYVQICDARHSPRLVGNVI